MRYRDRIQRELYYRTTNFLIDKRTIPIPKDLRETKNIFIYFDYEREFGGHIKDFADIDVDLILELLRKLGISATWFTVGKIFDKYPDSIKAILNNNHEIGCHTFNHIPPYRMTKSVLLEDINACFIAANKYDLRGFHSPNGLWSRMMFKYLKEFAYLYDVYTVKNMVNKPYQLWNRNAKGFIRLQSLGDDWPLYKNKSNNGDTFNYLQGLSKMLAAGDISGIGFHPWVIMSNPGILGGFEEFLYYLKERDEFNIQTASEFVRQLRPHR